MSTSERVRTRPTPDASAGLPALGLAALLAFAAAPAAALAEEAEEKGFWERDTLTGSWGGLRPALEETGVTVAATYTGEVLGNPSGGRAQRAVASGLLQVDVEADLDKLVGWQGGLFHVSGLHTHLSQSISLVG